MNKRILGVLPGALACALGLGGCGGGDGGGVISTLPPTTYTKIVDMSGNRTFQTAGVQYSTTPGLISGGVAQNFGSGVTVAYTASSDSYQLTAPDGSTSTFGPADLSSAQSSANTAVYVKSSGASQDRFVLTMPTSAAIPMSYTVIGTWSRGDPTGSINRVAIGGSPTLAGDMPKTGTATYTIGVGGGANSAGAAYTLAGSSTGTFSANFASGTVQATLNLAGTPTIGAGAAQSFGAFSGSGTISSSGTGFSGTLSGTAASGLYSGLFLGPQAVELGFAYYLNGATFSAAGAVIGAKQ
jgi:hypothetical protein